jgi:hypothetical protein
MVTIKTQKKEGKLTAVSLVEREPATPAAAAAPG